MTNTTPESKSFLGNKAYDILKFIALIFLPALAVLYVAIAALWDLPKATEVVATITAFDLFLGTLLGISTNNYKKQVEAKEEEGGGVLVVNDTNPNKDSHSFEITKPLSELENRDVLKLKVRKES